MPTRPSLVVIATLDNVGRVAGQPCTDNTASARIKPENTQKINLSRFSLGDTSGLTNTMWALIVDALSALVISILGWRYLKNPDERSFLEHWIDSFIEHNPRFFKR